MSARWQGRLPRAGRSFPTGQLCVAGAPVDPSITGSGTELLAAEALAAFRVVTVDGHLADSANLAHFGSVAGITKAAASAGFMALVAQSGELENPSWSWTPNTKLFLNGTALSATAPTSGFSQFVATAINATTILIALARPSLLW
jgi:hypothetical protein